MHYELKKRVFLVIAILTALRFYYVRFDKKVLLFATFTRTLDPRTIDDYAFCVVYTQSVTIIRNVCDQSVVDLAVRRRLSSRVHDVRMLSGLLVVCRRRKSPRVGLPPPVCDSGHEACHLSYPGSRVLRLQVLHW